MTMDRHDAIAAMLGEYALGHLSPEERRGVESHLEACAACAAELREYTLLMDGLARTPEPVAPRAALRQRVLDGLAPRSDTRTSRSASWAIWPLAAAAVLVMTLGTLLYVVQASRGRAESQLRGIIAELQQRLDQYAGQTDLALSILTAADMRRIDLAGRETATASAARAYWSPARGLLVVADELPAPPPGRIYQVWVIAGGTPVSAGLLGAHGTGRGMLIVPPPSRIAPGAVTVAVTDEPPGGLPAPSGDMRLVGSI